MRPAPHIAIGAIAAVFVGLVITGVTTLAGSGTVDGGTEVGSLFAAGGLLTAIVSAWGIRIHEPGAGQAIAPGWWMAFGLQLLVPVLIVFWVLRD